MENSNLRLKNIILEILSNDKPITSNYLSEIIGVTSRTIRSDIKLLNQDLKKIGVKVEAIRGVGYFIDSKQKTQVSELIKEFYLNDDKERMPVLPEERVLYILKKIIMATDFITIEEIANELYVSKSTIDNDLKRVEKLLIPYKIKIFKKPNYGIKLIGDEMSIRFCLSDSLVKVKEVQRQSEISLVDYELISSEDISIIRQITKEHLQKLPFNMADIPFYNLVVHISIAIERIKKGKNIDEGLIELNEKKDTIEYEVATTIVNSISKAFKINIPKGEISYITIHLLGAKYFENQEKIKKNNFIKVIQEQNYKLVIDILEAIEKKYGINFLQDQELIYGLGIHLRSAVNRFTYRMNLKNPLLGQIKKNYPFSFELAIAASEVIQQSRDLIVNEEEIGYIALHLEAAVERMRNQERRDIKRVAIVCASGLGTAKLLEASIKNKLPGLEIIGTFPSHSVKYINEDEVDLILSTVPVVEVGPIPILHINPILTESDINKIQNNISGKLENNIDPDKNLIIKKLFKEELFFPNIDLNTKKDIIKLMSKKLVELEYVEDAFEQSVLEREKISSTAIGNLIAIPHPLDSNPTISTIGICILKKPIKWDDKNVQLVLLLSLDKNKQEEFNQLFTYLWEVAQNSEAVEELCSTTEFTEFIELFVSVE